MERTTKEKPGISFSVCSNSARWSNARQQINYFANRLFGQKLISHPIPTPMIWRNLTTIDQKREGSPWELAVHFQTVFDASQSGYSIWWFPAFGLLFVCLGSLLVFAPATMNRILPRGPKGRVRTIFNWAFFMFAVAWTLGNFVVTYQQYDKVVTALRNGQYSVVEGPVTDFVPMPYAGHAMERFTVGGHRFSYSDYVVTPGFNNTASHGGPIREGLYVRVSYIGNLILLLEVAQ